MADVLTPDQRRLNMSRIGGVDTKPELMLRKALHARGLRFRLHRRDLPGRPDIAFIAARAVVFVHGCFWHGHRCPLFKVPATRTEFWMQKIGKNARRDESVIEALLAERWRTMVVWECALRGRGRLPLDDVVNRVRSFLSSDCPSACVAGHFASHPVTPPVQPESG